MCLLLFFDIYCLEYIYYPAGSSNPKLTCATNKKVRETSKIKMKNEN